MHFSENSDTWIFSVTSYHISNPLTSAQTLAIYHLLIFLSWIHTVWVPLASSTIYAFKRVTTLKPSSFLPLHHNLNPTVWTRLDPFYQMLLFEMVALCFSFLNCILICHFLNQLNILCSLSKPEPFEFTLFPLPAFSTSKNFIWFQLSFKYTFIAFQRIVTWIQLFIMMRYWRQILKLK